MDKHTEAWNISDVKTKDKQVKTIFSLAYLL